MGEERLGGEGVRERGIEGGRRRKKKKEKRKKTKKKEKKEKLNQTKTRLLQKGIYSQLLGLN